MSRHSIPSRSREADAGGIAQLDPLCFFEGYKVEEPRVMVLALAHNYERPKEVRVCRAEGFHSVSMK